MEGNRPEEVWGFVKMNIKKKKDERVKKRPR
jgi:hypothetical protein